MAIQNAINANATTPLPAEEGGSGVSNPTIHGILVAQGASAFSPKVLTDGQLLIGATGSDPVAASLSAGAGITITPGGGSITIASTVTGLTWNNTTGTSATLAINNGYTSSNAGLVTYTLPSTAAYGSMITVTTGTTAGGWAIAQGASQAIRFGNVTTTTGAGGSLASSAQGDTVTLLCTVANTGWQVLSSIGNVTYV